MITGQPPALTILYVYCTGGMPSPSFVSGSFRKAWGPGNWTSGISPVAMVKLMHYHYPT